MVQATLAALRDCLACPGSTAAGGGVSTLVQRRIVCPACRAVFAAEVVTGLHATRMPELREAILAGRLHRFECPECAQPIVLHDRTFVYTDFDRFHWFVVYPEDGVRHRGELTAKVLEGYDSVMRRDCPPLVREQWAPRFLVRAVFGLASLREKLILLDQGFDDRLIEVYKLQLFRDGHVGPFSPAARLWCEGLDGDELLFVNISPPGPEGTCVTRAFAVHRSGYDLLAADPEPARRGFPAAFGGVMADWRAAVTGDLPLPSDIDLTEQPRLDPPLR